MPETFVAAASWLKVAKFGIPMVPNPVQNNKSAVSLVAGVLTYQSIIIFCQSLM